MGAVDGGRSAPPTPAAVAAANDAGGVSAGDLAGAAAWSMIADEWGVSPSAPPPPAAASRASRALDDATPATQGAPPKMYAPDRASHSSAPTSGATLTARQLRHQMERPVVAAAEVRRRHRRLRKTGVVGRARGRRARRRGRPRRPQRRRRRSIPDGGADCSSLARGDARGARVRTRRRGGVRRGGARSRRVVVVVVEEDVAARAASGARGGPAAALADAFQTALFGLVSGTAATKFARWRRAGTRRRLASLATQPG